MPNNKNPRRDSRIIRQKLKGKSNEEIAKKEKMTRNGVFLALKRLNPQLLTALKRVDYDLVTAVSKMVELTDATDTQYFVHNGLVTDSREIVDNKTRLMARSQMLKLHGQLTNEYSNATSQMPGNTQVMVILGASIDRMERLKSPEHTIVMPSQGMSEDITDDISLNELQSSPTSEQS